MRDLSLVELEDEEIPEPENAQFRLEIVNEVHEDSAVKNDDNDDGWEDIELANCKTSKLGLQDLFISVRAVGTYEIPEHNFVLVKVRQLAVPSILIIVQAEEKNDGCKGPRASRDRKAENEF